MSSMAPATSTTPANEIWRPIRGYEDYYEVSNLARVRSLDRVVLRVINGIFSEMLYKGKILIQNTNTKGYRTVCLCVNNKRKTIMVHRLVADAFVPNPNNMPEVNHKDECKTNNMPSNLEWCTGQYNTNYGTGISRRIVKVCKPFEQLSKDGEHIASFLSLNDAQNAGYNARAIHYALKGQRKTAYGYQWRYI